MKRIDAVFLAIILIVSSFTLGANYVSSFSGTSKTMGDDFIEVEDFNASGSWYRGTTNLTDRLLGDWGSTNLTTTGAVSTADLNFTSEFYWNDENRTDTLAYPEQAASYIIFNSSNVIWAKNASTGQIDYGGTWDAGGVDGATPNAVLQAVADSLTDGGEIFFKHGIYAYASPVYIRTSRITLRGEAGAVIKYTGTILHAFYFIKDAGATQLTDFVVQSLKFTGSPLEDENHFLTFINCTRVLVEDCIFEDCGDEAITLGINSRDGIIRNNQFLTVPNATAAAIMLQSGGHIIEGNIIYGEGATTSNGIGLGALSGVGEIENVTIKNNIIYGRCALRGGIYLNAHGHDIKNIVIEGNQIFECIEFGIRDSDSGTNKVSRILISGNLISGGGTKTDATGAILIGKNYPEDVIIIGNSVYDYGVDNASAKGINIGSVNALVSGNKVSRCGGAGILISGNRSTVVGNTIKDAELASANGGIHVYSETGFLVTGNTIENGTRGINIEAVATDGLIIGNYILGCSQPIDDDGTDNIIIHNIGFVTDSSGTQTCADNENIAHGLAGTPTMVQITPMNDTYDSVAVIATIDWSNVDATNIKVGLYWVNGTAISDDIILVAWKAEYDP